MGGDGGVEERVDGGGCDVEGGAEGCAVGVEDVEGFGGGAGAREAGFAEVRAGSGEEGCEGWGGEVVVEDGFVADDDEFDEVPVVVVAAIGPGDDVGELGFGVGEAVVEVDAEDHFQAVGKGGVADVAEGGTVDGVEADGGEAFAGYGGDVGADGGGGEAGYGARVRGVGHGPLGGGGADCEVELVGLGRRKGGIIG